MPIPPATQTIAMLAGTVLAAAGLNLGVLSLDDPEPTPEVTVAEAAGDEPESLTQVAEVAPSAAQLVVALEATTEAPSPAPRPMLPSPNPVVATSTAAADQDGHTGDPDHDDQETDGSNPEDDEARTATPEPPAITDHPPTTGMATTAVPPTTLGPRPTEPPESEPPTTTTAAQTEYLTYEFSGVATVGIALHDGERLEFWSASPKPGRVYRVDDNGPDKVKIKFQRLSDGEESEFEVKFDDGELKVKQEA